MNMPASFGDIKTMSSVEIAKLTGKRHDNVMRVAQKLAEKGIINAPQIEERYNNNNLRNVYHLNKTESLNLVANLSPEFTARIIERWQELEQTGIPRTYPEALRLAAERAERAMQLEHQVEEMAPKAEFHDQVIRTENRISVAEAAKILGTGQNRLFAFMREHGWVTRRNEPYQVRIESGHLDVKASKPYVHPTQGLQQSLTTTVTGKGLVVLQRLYSERNHHQ